MEGGYCEVRKYYQIYRITILIVMADMEFNSSSGSGSGSGSEDDYYEDDYDSYSD